MKGVIVVRVVGVVEELAQVLYEVRERSDAAACVGKNIQNEIVLIRVGFGSLCHDERKDVVY